MLEHGHSYIDLPPGFGFLLWYLIEDGYISRPRLGVLAQQAKRGGDDS